MINTIKSIEQKISKDGRLIFTNVKTELTYIKKSKIDEIVEARRKIKKIKGYRVGGMFPT